MRTNPVELIDSGVAAMQAGKLDEALVSFRSAQALAPDDAEVMSLLGLVLTQLDQLEEAAPLLREAVKREPAQIGFRMNLVSYLMSSGLYVDAMSELTAIVKVNPAFPPVLEKLAAVQIALNEADQALQVLKKLAELDENNPVLFSLGCNALEQKQDWQQLEALASNWARSKPTEAMAWQMLCKAYMEQGRHRLALDNYRHVLENRPENPEDLSIYGHICLQCFEFEKAAVALARAEELDPVNVELLVCKSLLHTYFGEFELAEAYCRRAIQHDSKFAPAYTQLCYLLNGRLSDAELETLSALQSGNEQEVDRQIEIAFTLGRTYEARKDYASAFEAYALANRLNQQEAERQQHHYDENESALRTGRIMALYNADSIKSSLQEQRPCPIFIVGMPRSGTTLVEATVAAHSHVVAGGERPLLPQIANAALSYAQQHGQLPPAKVLQQWAGGYFSDLPGMNSANYFTDKNPLNIEAVGLIALLFPNAPMIHIRRNPLETCFSIYKNKFSKFWTFSHSLQDIAHFYGQYARLVSYWQSLLGERFLTVQYEELAAEFPTRAPEIIRHCGLTWEPACLDFQSENRAVPTLSAVQIREPVKTRNGTADKYAAFIQPLIDGLEAAGVDLDTGALKQGISIGDG